MGWKLSSWEGGLVKWCEEAEWWWWQYQWQAERPSVLQWESWLVHLASPSLLKLSKATANTWPLSRNTEIENWKIKFWYCLYSKNTTSLPSLFWGAGLEELPVPLGKSWSCALVRPLWTSESWSLPAAGREVWGVLGQSCWWQGEVFPWTLTTTGRLKLFHWPVLLLFYPINCWKKKCLFCASATACMQGSDWVIGTGGKRSDARGFLAGTGCGEAR